MSSSSDPARGPTPDVTQRALIDVCTHCGFCLPTCPTYQLWGEEMDSPRGRIVLMQGELDRSGPPSPETVLHLDRCLGCMACVTACPSGVRYDRLLETVRVRVEREFPRPRPERCYRRFLLAVFTRPGLLRVLAPLLALYRFLRLRRPVRRLLRRFPRLLALEGLAPTPRPRRSFPETTPAVGEPRARVALLQGCVQRVFFGGVNAASVRVLAAYGFEVSAPAGPRCCGALMLHAGDEDGARARAEDTIAALGSADLVVVNAAGCGSTMKEYEGLFEGERREQAAGFSARVRDISELLAEMEPRVNLHPLPLRVAYHDACHLAHAQGVRAAPRMLLASIPGLEVLEPDDWEICCGSAGVYNLLQPEAADELGRRKAESLLRTGAEAIAAANPGCTLQIAAHLERLGRPLPVFHAVEIVDAAIAGRLLPGAGQG